VGSAIGLVPHTGWAWLVRVTGTRSAPRVEARAKVVACDVLDGQLYHRAAGARDPLGIVARARSTAVEQASRVLLPHLGGVGAAVVLGADLALPPIERILAAHPRIHAAEGELWRAIFAEACGARGIAVTRATPEGVRDVLARWHAVPAIAGFLARGRQDVGPPWSRELQDAALAAWSLL
jgi:hypothetical protein